MHAVAVVFCSLFLACSSAPASAAEGDLDAGFGTGGVVTEPLTGLPQGSGVVLQDDGKVVSATIDDDGLKFHRYDSTGTPDATFGVGGVVTNSAPGGSVAQLRRQPDGKLVVLVGGGSAIARYDATGAPDGGFGTGGVATTTCGGNYADLLIGSEAPHGHSEREGQIPVVLAEGRRDDARRLRRSRRRGRLHALRLRRVRRPDARDRRRHPGRRHVQRQAVLEGARHERLRLQGLEAPALRHRGDQAEGRRRRQGPAPDQGAGCDGSGAAATGAAAAPPAAHRRERHVLGVRIFHDRHHPERRRALSGQVRLNAGNLP